jgi:site-specific recombinase XerD
MARHIRSKKLETRTGRLKLPVRKKATYTTIAPGIGLGYRRCKGAGRWCVRCANGAGSSWEKAFAIADDYEDSDGERVLGFYEAQDRARALARGTDADADARRPATLGEALAAYEDSLKARGGDTGNATRARGHLTPTLLSKPVGLLGAKELRRWRDGLVEKGLKPATINRTTKMVRAACNLAARDDARITNRGAWRDAFAALPDSHSPRDALLSDDQVHALIAAAWALDSATGLLIETLAITGARISQVARLQVADLLDGDEPRLMMPGSRKGTSRNRGQKVPVPISGDLAAKFEQAAAGRRTTDALLLKADGKPWHSETDDHLEPFGQAAAKAGLPAGVTSYWLRHSMIVRSLLAGVPIRVVAANVDSSVIELERTYSRYISRVSDAVARRALLGPAPTDKVVPLTGRRS